MSLVKVISFIREIHEKFSPMIETMFRQCFCFAFEKVWESVSDPFNGTNDGLIAVKDVRAFEEKVKKARYTFHSKDNLSTSVWIHNLFQDI